MRNTYLLIFSSLLFVLAGCGGQTRSAPDTDTATAAGTDTGSSARTGGVADTDVFGADPLQQAYEELLKKTIIYFDFDRSNIRSEFNELLAAHARYIADNPGVSVRFEGHADERGSREYNIGLGERRSQSVRRVIMLQGAAAGQLATISYGEERPVVTGSSETSWAKNRRVEIVYQQ